MALKLSKVLWCYLGCLSLVGAQSRLDESNSKCDIEAGLQQLEAHLDNKFNELTREVRTSSRNAEMQTRATKNAVEQYRNELVRMQAERQRKNHQPQADESSSELPRQIQVILASVHLLSSDMEAIRRNLTEILSATRALKEDLQVSSNIDQVFKAPSTPSSCLEIKQNNNQAPSSVYLIQPKGADKPLLVYCEMAVQNGGWTTIHNRFSGDQDFYKDWDDYKVGFGNVAGEHWLGLEPLHLIAGNQVHELLIQLVDVSNVKSSAYYSHFSIGSEREGYSLKVLGGFRGDAGDSLSYHAGSKFSTKDKDQDSWGEGHCAQSHGGAWWYKSCDKSNLNGRYLPGSQPDPVLYQSMYWDSFGGPQTGLLQARMLIRPRLS